MPLLLATAGLLLAALSALFFSTLSFALRDFSRIRLAQQFEKFRNARLLQRTLDFSNDLIFATSVARLFSNIMVLICTLIIFRLQGIGMVWQYVLAVIVSGLVSLLASVAVPLAAARYAGEAWIAVFAGTLHLLRLLMSPATKISHGIDAVIRSAAGTPTDNTQQIEEEILSVVQEGREEGVVDMQESEMIKSVIEFRDTTAGQIMTSRPEIAAIELPATLADVQRTIDAAGHSRIPVYERSLDHIVGMLYARDLLKFLGQPSDRFDLRSILRPVLYVPETKPLREMLRDFRLQKVHVAIVLDEYGSTIGLVTIEDILEELVGDIVDEHERSEPAMLRRINDQSWDVDARAYIDELNETLGLNLPDDAGFETLGGFITTTLGRIPTTGTGFDHDGVRYTVLQAEPQKVNRIRIDLPAQVATPAD